MESVPFAVITDGDPDGAGEKQGIKRLRRLLANTNGLYVGDSTFEIDLFKAGRHNSMCATLSDLSTSQAAKKRADCWRAAPAELDTDRFISDIKAIGKDRFAQRLATRIEKDICPRYVRAAIRVSQAGDLVKCQPST